MRKSSGKKRPARRKPVKKHSPELKSQAQAQTPVAAASTPEQGSSAPAKGKTSLLGFFRQVRTEMEKIAWTSRNETIVSTIMVLIMVTIMAIFFLLTDQLLKWIVQTVLSL